MSNEWTCPECGAGIESLLYARDVTVYSDVWITEAGKFDHRDNYEIEWDPDEIRVFCSECHEYFVDTEQKQGLEKLE